MRCRSRLPCSANDRHLFGVERWWFQQQFVRADVPMPFYSDDDPDQGFQTLDGDIAQAFAIWHAEYARHNGNADLRRERIDGTVGM